MDHFIEQWMRAVVRAPSGDNTQPWRFRYDKELKKLLFYVDESRDPSPMNAGQRMARIAVGAALENCFQVAHHAGITVRPITPPAESVAAIAFEGPLPGKLPDLPACIFQRSTNRRPYDGRLLPSGLLEDLQRHTPEFDGVLTHWIVDRQRLAGWASAIAEADALMFGEPSMRAAFLAKVRFDAPVQAEVEEGLSLASLEASAGQRAAMRLMRHMPDWLLKVGGGLSAFSALARKLVISASGLCAVAAPDDAAQTDVLVGRAMQRAWLALTSRGLASQPMMSLMVLDNALQYGTPALVENLGRGRLEKFRDRIRSLHPELGRSRLAFLFRIGFALPPSGRTGRLPLAANVEEVVSDRIGV